jgi:hypothetical protein
MMSAYDTGNGFSAAVYLPTPLRDIATATLTPYYANGYGASAGKFATYNAGWTALTTNTFSFLNPSHGYFTVARAAAFTANNSYVMAGNFKIENEL